MAQLRPGQAGGRLPRPGGLNLRDEIGRYWRIAQAHWATSRRAAGPGRRARRALRHLASREASASPRSRRRALSWWADGATRSASRRSAAGSRWSSPGGRARHALAGVRRRRASTQRLRPRAGVPERAGGRALGHRADGATLRILRDNASLTRPAWIEADLERIFTEDRYADFAALWLLAHETRFGRPGQPARDCPLEAWREAGREEGTRAREHLRGGVEEALVALGQGFLAHPPTRAAGRRCRAARSPRDYFQQLLRLVYRLIFLLTVEERGLLHPDGAATRRGSSTPRATACGGCASAR
ncbi:MAG: hypothetical protein IPP07_28465 [Holophagales bacterium]|nr:hypothetical protein [Holophagales bacterium]